MLFNRSSKITARNQDSSLKNVTDHRIIFSFSINCLPLLIVAEKLKSRKVWCRLAALSAKRWIMRIIKKSPEWTRLTVRCAFARWRRPIRSTVADTFDLNKRRNETKTTSGLAALIVQLGPRLSVHLWSPVLLSTVVGVLIEYLNP